MYYSEIHILLPNCKGNIDFSLQGRIWNPEMEFCENVFMIYLAEHVKLVYSSCRVTYGFTNWFGCCLVMALCILYISSFFPSFFPRRLISSWYSVQYVMFCKVTPWNAAVIGCSLMIEKEMIHKLSPPHICHSSYLWKISSLFFITWKSSFRLHPS